MCVSDDYPLDSGRVTKERIEMIENYNSIAVNYMKYSSGGNY